MHTELDEEHGHDDEIDNSTQMNYFSSCFLCCCQYNSVVNTAKPTRLNSSQESMKKKIHSPHYDIDDEEDDGDDDDDIEYDGELEIHQPSNYSKSTVSKLYSSLLQQHHNINETNGDNHHPPHQNNKTKDKEIEIITPPSPAETNNPLHHPPVSTEPTSRSRSSSSSSSSSDASESATIPKKKKEKSSTNKRSLSATARFQRFVTSKLASTSTGQDLMTQALGEETQLVIQWLISAVRKYESEEKANEMMEHFLKLSSKIAIYYSDGQLTPLEIQQFSKYLMPIFTSLYICLNCSTVSVLGGLDKLIDNIQQFHDNSLQIIIKLMSSHNSQRFTTIMTYMKQKEFLITIFTSEEFEENRQELKRIIKLLTE